MKYQTPYSKELRTKVYGLVEGGYTVAKACQLYGMPRKTYYKWLEQDHGPRDHTYHQRRPDRRLKLTPEVQGLIVKTKLKTNYGPAKMLLYLKRKLGLDISTTVIYRFYKRKMLIRKPQKRLPWYEPMKEHLTITEPGVGVQMDVKYVYENGRGYLFSCFDPYTESYYFDIFKTKHSKNAVQTFKKAERYFGFKILSVQTDNGSEARGEFHSYLTRKSIPHYFIPKSSPYWNAKVERVHKTIDDEYYFNTYWSWSSPKQWLQYYNEERIHLSLGGLTPLEMRKSVTL